MNFHRCNFAAFRDVFALNVIGELVARDATLASNYLGDSSEPVAKCIDISNSVPK